MTEKITIIFVINGQEFPVDVNLNQAIQAAVVKALQNAGIHSPQGWEVRTENGIQLDLTKSFMDQGITSPTKLFLSKGAGRGGKS